MIAKKDLKDKLEPFIYEKLKFILQPIRKMF